MQKFCYLKHRLAESGYDNGDLAELLDRSESAIKHRLAGTPGHEWTMSDQYRIMDLICEPYSRLHLVFPKDGVASVGGPTLENTTISELLSAVMGGGGGGRQ